MRSYKTATSSHRCLNGFRSAQVNSAVRCFLISSAVFQMTPHKMSKAPPSIRLLRCLTLQALITCLLCSFPISLLAQRERERWQRVYTGEDSIIEIDVSSLRFEPDQILRLRFRTILSKPESLREKPGVKFKSRLETIDFKSHDGQYRFNEIRLLDSMGNTVQSYEANSSGDWKVLKEGGIMKRLFYAIRALSPFGSWTVLAYRFGDGASDKAPDAPDVTKLIGTRVRLEPARAEVGVKVCPSPAYQSRLFTNQEFSRALGVTLESVGINSNHAAAIIVKCEGSGWAPPQSLLLELSDGHMLILWDGLFLVMGKRVRLENAPHSILKRRLPLIE